MFNDLIRNAKVADKTLIKERQRPKGTTPNLTHKFSSDVRYRITNIITNEVFWAASNNGIFNIIPVMLVRKLYITNHTKYNLSFSLGEWYFDALKEGEGIFKDHNAFPYITIYIVAKTGKYVNHFTNLAALCKETKIDRNKLITTNKLPYRLHRYKDFTVQIIRYTQEVILPKILDKDTILPKISGYHNNGNLKLRKTTTKKLTFNINGYKFVVLATNKKTGDSIQLGFLTDCVRVFGEKFTKTLRSFLIAHKATEVENDEWVFKVNSDGHMPDLYNLVPRAVVTKCFHKGVFKQAYIGLSEYRKNMDGIPAVIIHATDNVGTGVRGNWKFTTSYYPIPVILPAVISANTVLPDPAFYKFRFSKKHIIVNVKK